MSRVAMDGGVTLSDPSEHGPGGWREWLAKRDAERMAWLDARLKEDPRWGEGYPPCRCGCGQRVSHGNRSGFKNGHRPEGWKYAPRKVG